MTHQGAKVVEPADDAEWITAGKASALTGVNVTTVEWWASSGKIRTRPREEGPTIQRAGLLAYFERRDAERLARQDHGARRRKRSAGPSPARAAG